MGRTERSLFRIADALASMDEEERLVAEELGFHRHIADDARRDADLTGHYIDAEEAGLTAADVQRFERAIADIRRRRARLVRRRERLLRRLDR